MIFKQNVSSVA